MSTQSTEATRPPAAKRRKLKPPLSPDMAVKIAEQTPRANEPSAEQFLTPMLILVSKGFRIEEAANYLVLMGCRVPRDELIATYRRKVSG